MRLRKLLVVREHNDLRTVLPTFLDFVNGAVLAKAALAVECRFQCFPLAGCEHLASPLLAPRDRLIYQDGPSQGEAFGVVATSGVEDEALGFVVD